MTPDARRSRRELEVRHLGLVSYARARELQVELLEQRVRGEIPDQLLLLEHEPVVTLGRKTPAGEWSQLGIPVVEIERGGEATYHGPGQLVGYPIIELPPERRDLHRYLRDLEQVVIDVLEELGLDADRREGLTGVWVGSKKLCAIGVAVRRWVTWHGFALNVSLDIEPFTRFAPCGLEPSTVGRVIDFAELPEDDSDLHKSVERHFRRVFGYVARHP